MTGALNYQGFKETQSHFVDNYQKWDLDFILIYMDLDDFKHCNDAYGHGFGDMVLQEGVKRLQKIFNHYGVVARVGGDEFIALLPIVGSEDIRRIKQEIQQSLKAPCPLTVGPIWVEYPWALPAIRKQRTWMPCRNLLISGCTKIRKNVRK